MNKIKNFLENTKNLSPHKNVKEFHNISNNPGTAIDIGCGAGRDTVFLIKKGWKVTSIDKENTKDIIEEQLNEEQKTRFKFIQSNFENIILPKNNLIVANFSIPFCKQEHFKAFWNKIVNSIKKNRIFCRKFFGI